MHLAARYGHAANLVMRLAAADPALAERISPDLPDIAAEAASRSTTSRRTRWPTCCCAGRGSGCSTRRRLCERRRRGPARVARAMAGLLGWDDARVERELADWREVAAAEGLVPSLHAVPATPRPREEPSPTPRRGSRGGRVILRLRDRELDLTGPVIMGIVNATPDSFSDRGPEGARTSWPSAALRLVEDGRGDRRRGRRVGPDRHRGGARRGRDRARRARDRAAGGRGRARVGRHLARAGGARRARRGRRT